MKHNPSDDTIEETIRQLGKRFSELRKEKGYTQSEVSGRSGISVFTISTFENGYSTGITWASYLKLLHGIGRLDVVEGLWKEKPVKSRGKQ